MIEFRVNNNKEGEWTDHEWLGRLCFKRMLNFLKEAKIAEGYTLASVKRFTGYVGEPSFVVMRYTKKGEPAHEVCIDFRSRERTIKYRMKDLDRGWGDVRATMVATGKSSYDVEQAIALLGDIERTLRDESDFGFKCDLDAQRERIADAFEYIDLAGRRSGVYY